jgi:hypothetical protein
MSQSSYAQKDTVIFTRLQWFLPKDTDYWLSLINEKYNAERGVNFCNFITKMC